MINPNPAIEMITWLNRQRFLLNTSFSSVFRRYPQDPQKLEFLASLTEQLGHLL
jgi:hypothetical protein